MNIVILEKLGEHCQKDLKEHKFVVKCLNMNNAMLNIRGTQGHVANWSASLSIFLT